MAATKKKAPALVVILSALLFCYGFLYGGQQLEIAGVTEGFGMAATGRGVMVAIMHILPIIAPVLMGALADRIGKKKVLVTFAILFGGGCLLACFAPQLWVYALSLLIIGAGYSVCESLTSAVCMDVSPTEGARYVGLSQCLLSAGAVVGPIVISLLPPLPIALWRCLYLMVGLPLIAIGLLLSFLRFPKAEEAKAERSPLFSKALLLSPVFLAFFAAMFVYVGLENGFAYSTEPLISSLGATEAAGKQLSAYGISAYWIGMTLSRLLFNVLSYRPRRTVQLCFLAAATVFLLLTVVPNGYLGVLLCALVGAAYGPIWSTLVSGATARFPDHKGSAAGLMSAAGGLSGLVFPIIMGAVEDAAGVRIGFTVLAGAALIGAILSAVLNKERH